MKKLEQVFDPRLNSLNAVRFVLAASVIIYHSFPVTGNSIASAPAQQLLGQFFVDGFFAISGYLILSSWMRRPEWWPYLRARILRIMPAFWVSLIVTAAIIAPVGVLIGGQAFPPGFIAGGIGYVLHNIALYVNQYGIAGTPSQVPYPDVWNGSMWTLWWEFMCYLGILVLGVIRLVRWRAVFVVAFAVTLIGLLWTTYGHEHNYYVDNGSRFGMMFLAGCLIYAFQRSIPASWWLVGLAAGLTLVSAWLPDYRLIAAIPIAYLVIVTGSLVKVQRLRLRNDISYGTYIYAFPVQQLLASAGLWKLGVPVFALTSIVCTIPLAIASWLIIERPALRLKGRSGSKAQLRALASEEKAL